MNKILQSALYYATELQWPVFPCNNIRGEKWKAPLIERGFHGASKDIQQITKWFTCFPNAYIGVPAGEKTGFSVLDVDKHHNGLETLKQIESVHGELPITVQVMTVRGGHHYYFKYVHGLESVQGFVKGMDIRSQGSYVIVPPTEGYEWVIDQDPKSFEMAEMPEHIIDMVNKKAKTKGTQAFKDDDIPDGMRNNTMISIAGLYRKNNMSADNIFTMLKKDNRRCIPPFTDKELQVFVNSVMKYPTTPLALVEGLEELGDDEDAEQPQYAPKEVVEPKNPNELTWDVVKMPKSYQGKDILRNTYNNIINLLECKKDLFGSYRYNEFTADVEIVKYKPWMKIGYIGKMIDDKDILSLRDKLRSYNIQPNSGTVIDAVTTHASNYPYHPVRDYLTNLTWDGQSRVDTWLSTYCHAENNEYVSYIGKMLLVAACARVDKPGIKYDHMLILEGKQGIKKSSLVAALGGAWAGECNIIARDKDTVDKMRGKWIIEVPEMVCFRRQEIESIKAFISNPKDRVRLAYARKAEDFPRQNVFVGTFNPESSPQGYLTDMSGNRRFLPVLVDDIDINSVIRDRDQIFAEAWQVYKSGFDLYIKDRAIHEMAVEQQKCREMYDEMQDSVSEYLNLKPVEYVTGVEVWVNGFGKPKGDFKVGEQRRVGSIMKNLGWSRKQKKEDGCNFWAYFNPKYINEDSEVWDE
jgi:predicted P-loop ATPase